jgi:hypothetical protein
VAQILYRQNGPNNDPICGQGQSNFLTDLQAVAQAVVTRLQMFEGEWWANTADGLPLWQNILGQNGNNNNAIDLLIVQRILGTPFVTQVVSTQSSFNSATFSYAFSAVIQTSFGPISVSNIPTSPSQVLPS